MVVSVLALAGCGGGSSPSGPSSTGAAEPSVAPRPTTAPAGTDRVVGSNAEGIQFDSSTGLLAVAVRNPDRLQILDGRTLTLQRSVRLPGHARHLAPGATPGTVLVPCEDADTLLTVTLRTGASTSVKVGRSPHNAVVAAGGRIAVDDEVGGDISVVRDGRVERTITDHVQQPGGTVAIGDDIAVADVGAFTLTTYDITTGTRVATVAAGSGPTHAVAVSGGRIVVADTRGGALLGFTATPLKQITRLALPGGPYGLAYDPTHRRIWVTLTALNQVAVIDAAQTPLRVVARYPTVRQPNTVTVAADGSAAWVASRSDGTVQRITP